jgi:ribosomal protein L20
MSQTLLDYYFKASFALATNSPKAFDMSYSRLMNGLKKAEIDINRKMLSEIAISDEKAFGELVAKAKDALK